MIKTVAEASLPVLERLYIKKNSVSGGKQNGKRICVVTGIHGDELEGQYVCFLIGKRLREEAEKLNGTVDIYPAMNPLGIDSITRGIPAFDLDMNRVFPGSDDGSMVEWSASKIIEDLKGADLVIDIHASNIFLTELPQVRINKLHKETLVPLAKALNIDFIWVHESSTVLKSTLAYSLNSVGTPTLVVEMGVGMRITKAYGEMLTDGIFNLMREMGIWTGKVSRRETETIVADEGDEILFLNSPKAGLFIQTAKLGDRLEKGAEVGILTDPLRGEIIKRVKAPETGLLFTIREYPIVNEGSLIARMLREATK